MGSPFLWILAVLLTTSVVNGSPTKNKQKLVVILIDGFRWDYVDQQNKDVLPAFHEFHKEGVRAKWVNTIFPALSYPSWTTLSTGLHAENHNIIGNYFYDVSRGDTFELFNLTTTSLDKWWQHAEPIWTTATKKGLKVSTILWARSDIPFKGTLPAAPQGFVETKGWQSFATNLDRAFQRLKDGFDLVMVYTEHIDNNGHKYGPTSKEVQKAVREIDAVLLSFLEKLDKEDLDDEVNIMIVSDHGMASGSADSGIKYIDIDDYVDIQDVVHIVDRGAVSFVYPIKGREDKVYKRLKEMPGVDVYHNEDIPEKYHFKRSKYVPEILVVAKRGYFIEGGDHPKHLPRDPSGVIWNGFHGYDSNHPDMRTIFMAKGPAFKEHFQGEPLDLVDIYQIYAHVLNIPPQPHNGTWDRVLPYLKNAAASNVNCAIISAILSFVAVLRVYGEITSVFD